ncbi:MAG: mechanosensitive ion channel [Clostridiaceae bacterium]|nr:mechanosensitive ion channel [Clostridiaceae bacterium]
MVDFIKRILLSNGVDEGVSLHLSNGLALVFIVFLCLVADFITKKIILKLLRMYIKKSKSTWDDIFLRNKVFDTIAHIVPVLIIYAFAPAFPAYQDWIQRIAFSLILLIVTGVLFKALDSVDEIYTKHEVSKLKPIKGYLQVVKIFLALAIAIVIISTLIDRSPWVLLSGLGAATAVTMLIFQNSIQGFVAGIQLATNNMVRIGDWIEMPAYGVDGDVIEIALHTVKVQNWDKTIVTIPPYKLISESFKNWRGMQESGGRRIKRYVYIDMNSIKFCDDEMLERFRKIQYIKEYIDNKTEELARYNEENSISGASIVNGRHLTNIGTLRAYIDNYLKNHPRVNKNMLQIVRQLQPTETGLPIEIYAFTNVIGWVDYEAIQSDIFDHILAIIPEFDLRIYQDPSGNDIGRLKR